MTFRVVRTNQYNQDLGLIHSTNGNHLESPKEGSSIDHQVTIYLHAQNITMLPTNETWYFASQILVSNSGGLILILTAQSTRNMFRIHSAPHVAISDEAQHDQFINGLNPDVFDLVNTGRPNTFADALNRAKGAESGLLRQRRSQFVRPDARVSQEKSQIPPPPRFDAGNSSSGKKNFFTGLGKQFKHSGKLAPPVLVNSNNWELDRNLVITVPSVEADMRQNNVEECLAFAVFSINLDISREFVLNVILGIHRIREQRE
ncbi:hypothetical protein F511_41913 [Dorcoceras hygrometricum]|uniref:Uncharacterized protein n=1 Tax=Dorcoceras hygrometricum TaxID=472368 RepID=A0A2Z7AMA1_9LAMI|nr:hypothetical protein F511_41913 [Dorcoceras hygrometricum]